MDRTPPSGWTWGASKVRCCALAARAPYFHNGSAKDLSEVVDFYNQRFGVGLSTGEKADLVAFLRSPNTRRH